MSTDDDSEHEYGSKQYYERVTRDMTKFHEVLNNTRWKLPDTELPVFSKPTLTHRISGILSWVASPRVEFKVLDLVILLVLVGLYLGVGGMYTDFGQGLLLGAVVLFMSFAIVKPLINRFLDMLFNVLYRGDNDFKLSTVYGWLGSMEFKLTCLLSILIGSFSLIIYFITSYFGLFFFYGLVIGLWVLINLKDN